MIIANPQGVVFTLDTYDVTWDRMDTPDKRINLVVDELTDELTDARPETRPETPVVSPATGDR